MSRSLAACEGALLVVDAAQGVQAQTLANVYLALENDLEIIPVLNKIDLPAAEPERVAEEIESTIGLDCTDAILASAKSGLGIGGVLDAIVERRPRRATTRRKPTRCLIFDSKFDAYQGVVTYFRVVDGTGIAKGDKVKFLARGQDARHHGGRRHGARAHSRGGPGPQAGRGRVFCGLHQVRRRRRLGDTVTVVKSQSHAVSTDEAEHAGRCRGDAHGLRGRVPDGRGPVQDLRRFGEAQVE